ncbi:MAG: hypothetical protein P8X90_04175 [Desulfobacterales bacterium]
MSAKKMAEDRSVKEVGRRKMVSDPLAGFSASQPSSFPASRHFRDQLNQLNQPVNQGNDLNDPNDLNHLNALNEQKTIIEFSE